MSKTNICYHSLRLNMDNEQHQRVEKVLANLNTEIHKSVNKFIVDSIDFYIRNLRRPFKIKTHVNVIQRLFFQILLRHLSPVRSRDKRIYFQNGRAEAVKRPCTQQ